VNLHAINLVLTDIFFLDNALAGLSQGNAAHRNNLNMGLLARDA
jgi:hypothetical protein